MELLLISGKETIVSADLLNDRNLAAILRIFDSISSANFSSGKVPLPDAVELSRDVLDVVLDGLESPETSDEILKHLEQLRFLFSQPHFQVRIKSGEHYRIQWMSELEGQGRPSYPVLPPHLLLWRDGKGNEIRVIFFLQRKSCDGVSSFLLALSSSFLLWERSVQVMEA